MQFIKLIVIYARVSTIGQSIERQLINGRKLAKKLGYCEDQIVEIKDNGISARTTSINDRKGFSKVLKMIRNNQVETLIVSDRDRIARNMIEYLLVYDEIIKYDINVLFSTVGVTPFTRSKGLEADLAHYAEIEGNKIHNRSNDVRKYYPQNLFGYIRKGERSSTHYVQREDEIKILKGLFEKFSYVATLEDYKTFRKEWDKNIRRKVQKILTNTFYAACLFNGNKLEDLEHIKPIVTIGKIIENIEKFKKWGLVSFPEDNFSERIKQMDIPIVCDFCKEPLKQRKINHSYVYYCNHKKKGGNRNVSVSSKIIHERIIEVLITLIKNLDNSKLEELSRKHLRLSMESYSKDIRVKENSMKYISKKIMGNIESPRTLTGLLVKCDELEKEIAHLKGMQDSIKTWIKDIRYLISDEYKEKIELYLQEDIIGLGRMLIHSVNITNDKVAVFYNLSNAINFEGEIVINE